MYNALVKTKKACAFVLFSSTCYAVVLVVYGLARTRYVIGAKGSNYEPIRNLSL